MLASAIENETVTKELCLKYLELSDDIFRHTKNISNYLARAAARNHLAAIYTNEGDLNTAKRYLVELVSELQDAMERYGHNEDWDEYIYGVSEILNDLNE